MIPKKYSIKDYRIQNTEFYGNLCCAVLAEYTNYRISTSTSTKCYWFRI